MASRSDRLERLPKVNCCHTCDDIDDASHVLVADRDLPNMLDGIRLGRRWGTMIGLMAGIVQAHAVQPIAALTGAVEWRTKFFIAIAGALLYTASLIGLILGRTWGLWIAVFGPLVGLSAVLAGTALTTTIRPDAFQVVGGVLQLVAMVVAVKIITKHRES